MAKRLKEWQVQVIDSVLGGPFTFGLTRYAAVAASLSKRGFGDYIEQRCQERLRTAERYWKMWGLT